MNKRTSSVTIRHYQCLLDGPVQHIKIDLITNCTQCIQCGITIFLFNFTIFSLILQ